MSELVFVSSVQKELAEERRAVRDFVRGDALLRRFFDVFLFEDLPASDRRCEQAGLPEPDFRQDGGQFVQTLWRPRPRRAGERPRSKLGLESRPESGLESGLESEVSAGVLAAMVPEALSRSRIAVAIGHRRISGALNRALRELMARGLVEYTIPEKANSRLQRYRITDAGRACLPQRKGGRKGT